MNVPRVVEFIRAQRELAALRHRASMVAGELRASTASGVSHARCCELAATLCPSPTALLVEALHRERSRG